MIVYRELSTLEADLGVPAKTLYALSNHLDAHYRTVRIPKSDGSFRTLSVPDDILKLVQRKILQVLLRDAPVSPYAMAYRYGSSVLKNARPHVGRPMLLKLDIRRFFDSILYATVKEKVFPAERFSEPIRILLSILCYHKEGLPQGAPTSPAISNAILYDFDCTVGEWCREHAIYYTRFCDDMCFSGKFDQDEVIQFVEAQLKTMHLSLNRRKTKLAVTGSRKAVTGVVVNEKPNAAVEYRRKLRQELFFCKKFGIPAHLQRRGLTVPPEKYRQRLLGQVNFVLSITPESKEFQSYREWLKNSV